MESVEPPKPEKKKTRKGKKGGASPEDEGGDEGEGQVDHERNAEPKDNNRVSSKVNMFIEKCIFLDIKTKCIKASLLSLRTFFFLSAGASCCSSFRLRRGERFTSSPQGHRGKERRQTTSSVRRGRGGQR